MNKIASVKMQITKLLKKHGYRPSVPSKGRVKASHGLRLMDSGFEYTAIPFKTNQFYLGYYPGAFSTRISEAQIISHIEKMFDILCISGMPVLFERKENRILVTTREEL